MEVVVLVVVEGIRDVERDQSRSGVKSAFIVSNNPLNHPISLSKGYRTR